VVITGDFAIGGSVTYDTLNLIGDAGLDFTATLPPPTAPSGGFIEVTTATEYFAGLGFTQFVTTGQILNISDIAAGPNYTVVPAGVTVNIANFLGTFDANGGAPGGLTGLHFDLTEFQLASGFPPCPASPICEEGPFVLQQGVNGLSISFDMLGTFINGADSGDYTAHFVVTMDGMTLTEAANRLLVTGADLACGANNTAHPCGFTANFQPILETQVPEPATMLTFGAGSLLLARLRRRNKNKKA
jgi:hypothetical protein